MGISGLPSSKEKLSDSSMSGGKNCDDCGSLLLFFFFLFFHFLFAIAWSLLWRTAALTIILSDLDRSPAVWTCSLLPVLSEKTQRKGKAINLLSQTVTLPTSPIVPVSVSRDMHVTSAER
jgi:hypothetical protein